MNPDPTRNSCRLPEEVSPCAVLCFALHMLLRSFCIRCSTCTKPQCEAQAYDKDNEKVIEQPLPKVVPVPIVYPMPAPEAPAPSRGRSGLRPCTGPDGCLASPDCKAVGRFLAHSYSSCHSCQLD